MARESQTSHNVPEHPWAPLFIPVWNEAWFTGMLSPSCALCPGTVANPIGTLPPGPLRQHMQFTARTGLSDRHKTPLWPINNYWSKWVGTLSLVFHRQGHITPPFTPLLKLLSQLDENLQLNNKYRFDAGPSWNVSLNQIQSSEPWITYLIIIWNIKAILSTLREQARLTY